MGVVIGGVALVVGLLASAIAIWQVVWPFFKRRVLGRPDPQPATTRHIDTLAQRIEEMEGKVDRALEYLDGVPTTDNKQLKAAYQEARILQLEGYEAQNADKHREAIDRFSRALALAETDSQRAALHLLRGNSHLFVSDYERAQRDYAQVLSLCERMSSTEDVAEIRAVALGNLGLVYADRGEPDKAEEHHRRALRIDREIGNRLGEAATLGNLGLVYSNRGQLEKAEEHHKSALDILREMGDGPALASQLGNLGLIYGKRGALDAAKECFELALSIHEENGDTLGQAGDLGNLGIVYAERGELDKAEEHHKRALDLDMLIGNRHGEAQDLNNLGIVYAHIGDLDRAEAHHVKALSIATEIGDRGSEADALGYLGFVDGNRGELGKAEEHHRKALEINREIGNRLNEANGLGNLGLVYHDRGDMEQATEHLRRARAIYQAIGAGGKGPELVRRALEALDELERQQREGGEKESGSEG